MHDLTPFSVRRSPRARRPRLTLSEAGEAVVVLPVGAADGVAGELVGRHRAWLERHRRRIHAERAILAARPPLGEGRELPLRGVPHRVLLERRIGWPGRQVGGVRTEAGPPALLVVTLPAGAAPATPAELLERWLRRQARADLAAAVERRAGQVGVSVGRLTIRDQRTRWASASRRGTLSFSWRLLLAPPEILDYVVVHELAHLRWAGHGVRFWSLVRNHVPDADEHRRWLRANQHALRRALD